MPTPREELANLLRESRIEAGYRSHAEIREQAAQVAPWSAGRRAPPNPVPSDDVLADWAQLTGADLGKLQDLVKRIRLGPPKMVVPGEVIETRPTVICWFAALLIPRLWPRNAAHRSRPDSALLFSSMPCAPKRYRGRRPGNVS